MQTGLTSQARAEYEAQGYHLRTEPVVPADLVQRAVEGMDAIRAGHYDTGRPPEESPWNPGDDPAKLCKIEMPQFASRAIFDLAHLHAFDIDTGLAIDPEMPARR